MMPFLFAAAAAVIAAVFGFAIGQVYEAAYWIRSERERVRAEEAEEARIDAELEALADLRDASAPLVVAAPPVMNEGEHVVGVVENGRVRWLTEQESEPTKTEQLH